MTAIKTDTIGTGITTTYKTIEEWWSAVTSAHSSNLVADDRILVGQLVGGNHHLNSRLDMTEGSVTVDANRYVILTSEDRAAFSGIIPVLTNTQNQYAFVTGSIPRWFNCSVPHTQFRNFNIKTLGNIDNATGGLGLIDPHYIFNLSNTGLIDSVGIHAVPTNITSINNGSRLVLDYVKLYQCSTIRNSVFLHPNLTISGSMTSCMFGMSVIEYDDTSSVLNNTILNGGGNLYLTTAGSRDSTKLHLYGIKEKFSPLDIEDCWCWLDFDDSTTLCTNTIGTTLLTTSGVGIAFIGNRAEIEYGTPRPDCLWSAIQSLPTAGSTTRRMVYKPNYINGRGCAYGLKSTATNNGSGLLITGLLDAPLADSGYTIFAVASIAGNDTNKALLGLDPGTDRYIMNLTIESDGTEDVLWSHQYTWNTPGTISEEVWTDIDYIGTSTNPFRVYTSVVDPYGLVNPTGRVTGHADFSSSGYNFTDITRLYWRESLYGQRSLGINYTRVCINGKRAGTNNVNIPTTAWGEFIFYDRPLNSGEVYKVNRYLAEKWHTTNYRRNPDAFLGQTFISTGNVYNNYVQLQKGGSSNGLGFIAKNYSIPHDDYSYNAGQDSTASGLFPNNINYTGILAPDNFTSVSSTGQADAHILQDAFLRSKGTPQNFSYDVDGLPRYNWDVGADEYRFVASGDMTMCIFGHSENSGDCTLYINGHIENSGDCTLYMWGHSESSGDPTLYIQGHLESSGNPDLYICGHIENSGDIPLCLFGHQESSGQIPLYILGHQESSGDIPLYINGHVDNSGDITLYILGHMELNTSIPLTLWGHENDQSGCPLFMWGHENSSSGCDLFIGGHQADNTGIPLYVGGKIINESGCTLNIYGKETNSDNITLFLMGNLESSGNPELFICGHDIGQSGIDLYLAGKNTESGVIPLCLFGHETQPNSTPLYIGGKSIESGQTPLYLVGKDLNNNNLTLNISGLNIQSENSSIPLSILGYSNIEGNIDLYVGGKDIVTSQSPLWIQGNDVISNNPTLVISGALSNLLSNNIPLYIPGELTVLDSSSALYLYGHENSSNGVPLVIFGPSIVVTPNNVRNCIFNFNIPDALLDLQEEVASALLLSANIGVDCAIYYPPTKEDCPNCEYNTFIQQSANIYSSGGPVPFVNGTICPYCNGDGFIYSETSDTLNMKVYWNPKDWINIGFDVQNADGIIQTQALTRDIPKIQRSNYMVPNLRTASMAQYKYKLIKESVPHGFTDEKFFISYWKRI